MIGSAVVALACLSLALAQTAVVVALASALLEAETQPISAGAYPRSSSR